MRLSNVSCIDFVTRLEDANVRKRWGIKSSQDILDFLRELHTLSQRQQRRRRRARHDKHSMHSSEGVKGYRMRIQFSEAGRLLDFYS